MNDADDSIDEVALNVLVAEGVDVPTALEASRISLEPESVAGQTDLPKASAHLVWYGVVLVVALLVIWMLT